MADFRDHEKRRLATRRARPRWDEERMLSRTEMLAVLAAWCEAWNAHDFEAVMALFHDEVVFDNWTGGRAEGKAALRAAWGGWFADHGEFQFEEEETFVDDVAQKALYRWTLRWPCREPGHEAEGEVRRGVDVLHFQDDKIIRKLTYSKTTVEVGGKRVRLRYDRTIDDLVEAGSSPEGNRPGKPPANGR